MNLYRRGRAQEAEAACERLLARAKDDAGALTLLADIRLSAGKTEAAISNLWELALLQPGDAANHRRLGAALLSSGRAMQAADVLRRAVELEPGSVRAHNNLGQALLQTGEISAAIRHCESALRLDPDYAIGYNNLGLALTARGEFDRAVAAFQRALALDTSLQIARMNMAIAFERSNRPARALEAYEGVLSGAPRHADALTGRGAALVRLNRAQAALDSFDAALGLRADDATILAHKASALLALDRAAEALVFADAALRRRESFVDALNIRAAALCTLFRPAEALRCIDRALELDPRHVESWCTGALVHQNLGDHRSAVNSFRRALSLDPACVLARTRLISACIPSVPDSAGADSQARIALDAELTLFEEWLRERELNADDAWTVAKQQFFHLSYQEESNKALLQRYRRTSARRLACAAPEMSRPREPGAPPGKFRLGIASAHVFDHSVYSAIVQGWLRRLDRGEFETLLFSLGAKRDAATEEAEALVDHFESGTRTAADWAVVIRQRKLDALIFPEIGMDPTTLALANLRLAPRQFAAWGHPETSGLPTIDYYLSAEAFEPADADEHYSEKLIRLPNLGVYYEPYRAVPTPVDFGALGIPADGPRFVCPGTPFKYRPEDDSVLIDIARRVRRCSFIFFNHDKVELSNKLRDRLAAAFTRAGLDPGRYLVWIPWLPRPAFLGLLRQADVYLDTIGFSGFNTLMQAVEVHLPSVAYEGRFMRGRLGSGILRRLGLPELVASNRAHYVDIAVQLAENTGKRAELRDKLRLAEHRAYADGGAVDALARVLLESRSGFTFEQPRFSPMPP